MYLCAMGMISPLSMIFLLYFDPESVAIYFESESLVIYMFNRIIHNKKITLSDWQTKDVLTAIDRRCG